MVKKGQYDWASGIPPELGAHSIAKHEVLEAYLFRYLEVLTQNILIPKLKINLVDGFCGGGIFTDELSGALRPGSPIILLNTVKAAEAAINLTRDNNLALIANYYLIDKSEDALKWLRKNLSNAEPRGGNDNLHLIKGEFRQHAEKIISDIETKSQKSRTIFLLDQYGFSDVPFGIIKQIFRRLPRSEVLLTFSSDRLIDFLSLTPDFRKRLENAGISSFNPETLDQAKSQTEWRFFIQKLLSESLHKESGALYFTPFFIKSRKSNRSYWFIHLSNHPRARDEMVQIHWKMKNHFVHHGRSGLFMLGYDPAENTSLSGKIPLFGFGEAEKAQSIEELMEDYPRFMVENHDADTFGGLVEKTINTTPAAISMMQDAIFKLADCKELIIKTPKGAQRRSSRQISSDDKIIRNPQRRFHFFTTQRT